LRLGSGNKQRLAENKVSLNEKSRLKEIDDDKAKRDGRTAARAKVKQPEVKTYTVTLDNVAKPELQLVTYDKPTLGVSPATTKNWPHGMSVAALCEAAVIYSDNTAANVLLEQIGGPAALTQFWRSLGDQTSRLDDIEPKLNLPDGERNTTTPTAMLGNLKEMLLGNALSAASRARLLGWMHANTTGAKTLRAGLPAGWQVGDKTGHWIGSDPKGWAVNDFAIITPPARKPILAIALTQGGSPDDEQRVAVLAEIGRILADAFA